MYYLIKLFLTDFYIKCSIKFYYNKNQRSGTGIKQNEDTKKCPNDTSHIWQILKQYILNAPKIAKLENFSYFGNIRGPTNFEKNKQEKFNIGPLKVYQKWLAICYRFAMPIAIISMKLFYIKLFGRFQ